MQRANCELPVFPNWFPFNDMVFDGHLKVGKYEAVKTRSWNWDYRGPVLFYNSSRGTIARKAVEVYGYQDSPSRHKIIIGVGNLVEVRFLTRREAVKMVCNFNKMTQTEVEKLLLQFGPNDPIEPTQVNDYSDCIAPYEIGFFLQGLKRFETPVSFNWPPGPRKPIFTNVKSNSELSKQLITASFRLN